MSENKEKPHLLILGGTGFIGRNLLEYVIENDLVSKVRVVDKVPPQTAWLNAKQQEVFANPRVEFKSANLINPCSCESAFSQVDGEDPFDYVVNLACETRIGQCEPVYHDGIIKLSVNCAKEAEKRKVKRYIELSSGYMFTTGKFPNKEEDKAVPSLIIPQSKLIVEGELNKLPYLNFVIIRPAIVYGIGDKNEITPRLIIGSIYKYLGETMKLFWDKEMKLNTVHVRDVCRAIWHLLLKGKNREVYNVVDKGDTNLGKLTDLISEIFNINHDYVGTFLSSVAKKNDLSGIVEEVNEKHLSPWAEICSKDGIVNTPLTPYIHEEHLLRRHVYLDGSKIESSGFAISEPEIRIESLIEVLNDYVSMGLFPVSLLS